MDQDPSTTGPAVEGGGQRTPEQIEADIARTRQEVGDTVEALAAKTDVKAQARHKIDELKGNAQAKVEDVKAKAQSATPDSAQQGGQQIVSQVRANRVPLLAAAGVVAVFLLGRRSGKRSL